MSKNVAQVYIANPVTTIGNTDLFYTAASGTTDAAFTGATLKSAVSPLTTKGDLFTFSTVNTRLAVGATNGQVLQVSSGAATGLAWSTATYPLTTTINQLLYSSSANVIAGLSTANNGVLITSNSGVPSFLANSGTAGFVLTANSGAPPSWQATAAPTGAALTEVNDTNVTLTLGGSPTTALLQATSITAGWTGQLSLTRGGTNASLTASNGGIVYSTASAMAILSGTATANLPLLSGSSTTPSWGSFALSLGGALTTAGALTTSGAFAATFTFTNTTSVTFPTSGTLATTSQIPTGAALTKTDDTNVTLTLGGSPSTALVNAASITAGWTGTLSGTRGGTGVNNGSSTITIGGNVTFSGAFTFTGTVTANTSVTFPTSGTLATTAQLTGLTWNDVSGTSQSAAVNNGYIISNASQTTVTIPATAAEGSLFAVQGKGAAGWILQMNTGQICHLGSSATSSAGSLTSTNQWDAVEIICVTANTTFAVRSAVGNITIA